MVRGSQAIRGSYIRPPGSLRVLFSCKLPFPRNLFRVNKKLQVSATQRVTNIQLEVSGGQFLSLWPLRVRFLAL